MKMKIDCDNFMETKGLRKVVYRKKDGKWTRMGVRRKEQERG